MDIKGLLKTIECSCGKVHSCDIRDVVIGSGVISQIGDLTQDYNHILLVADKNTFNVCGEQVAAQLDGKTDEIFVYEDEGILVPDEVAIEKMQKKLTCETDLIVGIGSGVIQDLCKYVSFNAKLPYHIIATAPSMDGYASKGAAMIIGNMKVTYNAHVPEVIVADTNILKAAPMDMIKSGYGDILGKFSCLNDWKLSHVVNDEYICDYVYDLTYSMLDATKDLGAALLRRDEMAVGILMEALVGVGIAMAYVGNSRPASGSEHHMSHFFEVIGIMKDEPYFMHGTDVAFSAVYTQKMREELIKLDEPVLKNLLDKESREKKIREIYFDAAEGVIALQNKLGWYEEDKISIYKERWSEIRDVLSDTPSSDELIKYLESIGLDIEEFDTLYGKEKINNAIRFSKDLKDRYTVLWMYNDLC